MTATPHDDTLTHPTGPATDGADGAQRSARRALEGLAAGASDLARDGARELRRYGRDTRDDMADRIRERPLQAMLIAAGAGAAIAFLSRALFNAGRRDR